MKRVLGLLLVSLVVLTGCQKKVVCTGSVEENGMKSSIKVEAVLENDKISKASADISFSDEASAKDLCDTIELANSFLIDESDKIGYKCSKTNVKLDNYLYIISDDEQKKSYTKDEFIKLMEEQELTCK